MAATKANVYDMVTARIIAELEKGIIPWEKPWTGIRAGAYNRVSKKPYSMINQMLLKHTGEYATFKQWQDLGGHVKKGEKSEIVVFWKILEKEETDKETGEKEVKKIPMLRYYNVFHISQVEGVKPLERPFAEVEPIAEGDKIIVDYITREHIKFDECASNEAYYSPSSDRVVVPMKEQYKAINEYYSTTFHELTHSTGHKNRLNRLQTGAVFIQGDLFENIAETYDMIVSNPPYIRTEEISSLEDEVKLHDPWIALDGKTDGLYFYRLIVKESVKHIKKGGYLLFETGFDQGKDVSVLLEEQGYEEIQVKKDLAGLDRVVMGRYNKE